MADRFFDTADAAGGLFFFRLLYHEDFAPFSFLGVAGIKTASAGLQRFGTASLLCVARI